MMNIVHRRQNPLTGEWVLVSPHRTLRPWQGQVEKASLSKLPAYDPDCYLCPGNARAEGKKNNLYTSTYVFDNDFPALLYTSKSIQKEVQDSTTKNDFFRIRPEIGITRVMCFSPRHDLSIPELSQSEVEAVVRGWIGQSEELSNLEEIQYVQIFENKGAMMGASNPHPHNQIWASSHIPNEPAKETTAQSKYLDKFGACLLCSYLESEIQKGDRIVTSNNTYTALVPFWAVWPFEVLLVANRHLGSFSELSSAEVSDLADILRRLTCRYDNLFKSSFPYSMGFHQAPCDGLPHQEWHFHAHYYPPLLRSATVRKFMVGYEMLAMPQRDLPPEHAADRLRALSELHYRSQKGENA
jgi:UDPglucose--hexose-1-phosphate uridylyltransferase